MAAFTRFLEDGRICLHQNNAAERAAAGVSLGPGTGPSAVPTAGGTRGGRFYTLIATAKNSMMAIPKNGSADVLRRINGPPASRFDELIPWNWLRSTREEGAA